MKTSFQLAFVAATTSTEVALLLQPLQGRSRDEASSSTTSVRAPPVDKQKARIQQLEATITNLNKRKTFDPPGQHGRGRGRGRGGGGGRGRGRGRGDGFMSLTEAMASMTLKLPAGTAVGSPGDPVCYNFNLGKCTRAVPGQRCPVGWHVCCKPGCQQAHTMANHR